MAAALAVGVPNSLAIPLDAIRPMLPPIVVDAEVTRHLSFQQGQCYTPLRSSDSTRESAGDGEAPPAQHTCAR